MPEISAIRRRYLFGPVASRRLGLSLGVDLVPAKVCSMNCIYCEAGLTTRATLERAEYIPTAAVLQELAEYLEGRPTLDSITFSGAGEPTLHSGIGRIIAWIKAHYPDYRLTLLTNATLFPDPAVRAELCALDLVVPSLDAADDDILERINRPVAGLTAEAMIAGLSAFRKESVAAMWLEIFIVPGVNDGADHLRRLREAALRIAPDRVQLNTLDRPGPESWVRPAERSLLERIAAFLQPLAVEITVAAAPDAVVSGGPVNAAQLQDRIIDLIRRRPCTAQDLAIGLDVPPESIRCALQVLEQRCLLSRERRQRGIFYRLPPVA